MNRSLYIGTQCKDDTDEEIHEHEVENQIGEHKDDEARRILHVSKRKLAK